MNPNNQFGMSLDNVGIIGKQGGQQVSRNPNSNCTSNNNWLADNSIWSNNGNFKTNTQNNSNAKKSVLYVDKYNTALNPDGSGAVNIYPSIPYTNSIGSILYTTDSKKFDCQRCKLTLDLTEVLSKNEQQLLEEAIATGDIEIPTSDSLLRLYVMQEQLYEKLMQEQEATGSIGSSTLQSFMQNNSWDSYDYIYYTAKYLAQKDMAAVNMLLNYFPSNNIVDDNYWQYYKWQQEMITNPAYKPNANDVLAIANLCPFSNGNIVYAARNLYNRLTRQNKHFKNDCDNTLSMARQQNVIVRNSAELGKALVYPNPSNSIINIKLGLNNKDKYQIKVIDILGNEIASKITSDMITTLNLGNRKGICFVRICNINTGKVQIEKLILQ
jgi:hypothetical protein